MAKGCHYTKRDGRFHCLACKAVRSLEEVMQHEEPCPTPEARWDDPGLGDRIENWLTSWGVTKERYKEVKRKFHLPPTCDCDGRQEWFNRVGAYFNIAADKYGPHKDK